MRPAFCLRTLTAASLFLSYSLDCTQVQGSGCLGDSLL